MREIVVHFCHDMTWEMVVFQVGEHVWHGITILVIGAVHLVFKR